MSQSIKDRFIPLVALLLGVAVVYAVGSFQQRTQAAAEAEIQQKFDALESVEQERLLDRAASMSEAPERFVPLQHIHTALKTDPELSDKLKRLHKWWLTLDPDNKNKLKSGNRFADGWVQQVKEVYLHTRNQPGEFVIKLRNWSDYRAPPEMFRTDEAAFRHFLEQILPKEEYPEDLRQRLSGLPGADQECERTLAVMISLREQIDRVGRSGEKPEDTARVARIGAAVSDTLFASEERQRLEQLAEEIVSNAPSDRIEGVHRMWQRYVTMAIFHHAKEHYSSVFHAKHLRQHHHTGGYRNHDG